MADTNKEIHSGLSTLPDGRLQVIFQKTKMDNILQVPLSIYAIVQELTLLDGEITEYGKSALFDLINIAEEIYPDTTVMQKALEQYKERE